MQTTRTLEDIESIRQNVVVAIGVFDGVHRGHQQVINLCREQAAKESAEPWVMTFEPHPLRVVQPASAPPLLTSLPAKIDILSGLDVAGCMVIPFTHAFSLIEPEAFLDQLVKRISNLKGIVIGENWHFGRKARGDVALLRHISRAYDFHVQVSSQVSWQGAPVSSTRIRESIAAARLDDARSMLGRPYAVRGEVIHGKKRGRHLGFPTANIDARAFAVPPPGIYAAYADLDGHRHTGAVYLPSDRDLAGNLEVHLLDFSGDLYGRDLNVEFAAMIREDNRRFTTEQELARQIQDDVTKIRRVLQAGGQGR